MTGHTSESVTSIVVWLKHLYCKQQARHCLRHYALGKGTAWTLWPYVSGQERDTTIYSRDQSLRFQERPRIAWQSRTLLVDAALNSRERMTCYSCLLRDCTRGVQFLSCPRVHRLGTWARKAEDQWLLATSLSLACQQNEIFGTDDQPRLLIGRSLLLVQLLPKDILPTTCQRVCHKYDPEEVPLVLCTKDDVPLCETGFEA
mmetsp:Transcript_38494/g.60878  ORF Transcript_38494/g.60878 Transcript_38494/m.60878 type:complete len:202 (+) Transcript_38494:348-953(+)